MVVPLYGRCRKPIFKWVEVEGYRLGQAFVLGRKSRMASKLGERLDCLTDFSLCNCLRVGLRVGLPIG